MPVILDGKATAAAIRSELKETVAALTPKAGRVPGLAVILVGEDPASQVYVRFKERACAEIGVKSEAFRLPKSTPQQDLMGLIDRLNAREDMDGILLQLPLPDGLESHPFLGRIRPDKDVDGFHPENMGRLSLGLPGLRPCTPEGVMELMRRYGISPSGKRAVVVGRSNIVGKPLSYMLAAPGKDANATVTVCHSGTRDLAAVCREADILCAAIGKPRFITADMVKPGAVVLDIGINRVEGGLCGDCDFDSISRVASAITPVPGGVGPMTIAILLRNTVKAWCTHTRIEETF